MIQLSFHLGNNEVLSNINESTQELTENYRNVLSSTTKSHSCYSNHEIKS